MKEMLTRIILFLNFFLRILVYPLKRLSLLLFPSTEYDGINQSAEIGAKAFSFSFQKLFLPPPSQQTQPVQTDTDNTNTNNTNTINPFVNMGYTKCVVESQKQNKIVLLYLHSPMHPQCNKFCSSILSHPRVVQKLSSPSFICWGSSIQYAEAANVARMFNVTSYPFVALIASGLTDRSSSSSTSASAALSKVELLWKMEGGSSSLISLDEFSRSMEMVHTAHQSILSEIETRRLRREEEIRLRNEQDREYQETLLADQKRIAEKEALEEKKRLEQQQKDELKQLELAKKESLLHEARSLLAASQEPKTGEKCARIRITLPSGVKIDRRFQPTDQIKHVRAFLTLYFDEQKIPIQNFSLSSSYPRRTYDDDELTLQEGGLCPMAVLMLVDLDA